MAQETTRPYVVLEKVSRNGSRTDFRLVGEVEARNSEHAARLAFRTYRETFKKGEAQLVTIPVKMWSEQPVKGNVRETVTVG